jgi:hypothetical protein
MSGWHSGQSKFIKQFTTTLERNDTESYKARMAGLEMILFTIIHYLAPLRIGCIPAFHIQTPHEHIRNEQEMKKERKKKKNPITHLPIS